MKIKVSDTTWELILPGGQTPVSEFRNSKREKGNKGRVKPRLKRLPGFPQCDQRQLRLGRSRAEQNRTAYSHECNNYTQRNKILLSKAALALTRKMNHSIQQQRGNNNPYLQQDDTSTRTKQQENRSSSHMECLQNVARGRNVYGMLNMDGMFIEF
jgi:hypothetical protein